MATPRTFFDGLVGAQVPACARAVVREALRADDGELVASSDGPLQVLEMPVDTKYYSAHTQVSFPTSPEDPVDDALIVDDRVVALCFVFDASNLAGFSASKTRWERVLAARIDDGDEFESVLCIANNSTFSDAEWSSLQPVTAWCSEHFVELVRANTNMTNPPPQDEGFPRVVEALHSVMWPNMVRKTSPTRGQPDLPTSSGEPSPSKDPGARREQDMGELSIPEQVEPGLPEQPSEVPLTNTTAKDPMVDNFANLIEGFWSGDGDDSQDDLMSLMEQAAKMRGALQGLPDEQRRTVGSDLALKLFEKLGIDNE